MCSSKAAEGVSEIDQKASSSYWLSAPLTLHTQDMTLKDTISGYLHKGKGPETSAAAESASPTAGVTAASTTATTEPHAISTADPVPSAAEAALRHAPFAPTESTSYPPAAPDQNVPLQDTSTVSPVAGPTPSLSRSASMSVKAERYKATIINKLPVGQFDIGALGCIG